MANNPQQRRPPPTILPGQTTGRRRRSLCKSFNPLSLSRESLRCPSATLRKGAGKGLPAGPRRPSLSPWERNMSRPEPDEDLVPGSGEGGRETPAMRQEEPGRGELLRPLAALRKVVP